MHVHARVIIHDIQLGADIEHDTFCDNWPQIRDPRSDHLSATIRPTADKIQWILAWIMSKLPNKCHENGFITFREILLTTRQTSQPTWAKTSRYVMTFMLKTCKSNAAIKQPRPRMANTTREQHRVDTSLYHMARPFKTSQLDENNLFKMFIKL